MHDRYSSKIPLPYLLNYQSCGSGSPNIADPVPQSSKVIDPCGFGSATLLSCITSPMILYFNLLRMLPFNRFVLKQLDSRHTLKILYSTKMYNMYEWLRVDTKKPKSDTK